MVQPMQDLLPSQTRQADPSLLPAWLSLSPGGRWRLSASPIQGLAFPSHIPGQAPGWGSGLLLGHRSTLLESLLKHSSQERP